MKEITLIKYNGFPPEARGNDKIIKALPFFSRGGLGGVAEKSLQLFKVNSLLQLFIAVGFSLR
jgi:hypothetical protein